MLKFILPLFLLGFLSLSKAQTLLSDEVKANIKLRVDNGINTGIVVGIIDGDKTQYYSYGIRSLTGKEPVDEHSVFEIGSITKTFTGIILADKVINGKMNLDDPLQKYLPEGVTAPTRNGASIKLVHLSNHTSSLPRMPGNFNPANPANPFADYTEKQLYDFLKSYALPRDIGSKYEYSNYAAGLLGHIMATMQGTTYEALMIDVIAGPLGMQNTRIAFTPNMKKNLAMGHHDGIQVENWDLTTLAGAGAIRSTTVDMLKYLRANMGKGKSKLYPAMQLSHRNSRAEGANPIVGLGWHTAASPDIDIVWHNGGTGGYRTFAGFIKGGDRGVVVLSNSTVSIDDIGLHLLNPKAPLTVIKPSIAAKIRDIIDTHGISTGLKTYRDLKIDQSEKYDFGESQLSKLGKDYLAKGETDKAIAIFSLNAEVYPESSDIFYRLGDAFMKRGDKERAIENYKKSVSLNPGNQQAIDMLKKSGIDAGDVIKETVVDTGTLESYVGKYELAPGFILAVSREGNQLKAQATGQPEFPVFPKSKNVFYLKVVEAQLTFNQNGDGQVESVTLHQGGRDVVGKKLEK
jgi:D-alanyl-D-alanine-carboxypeptidase/D-alanyl-D-alanine-endopeptidase